MVARQDKDEGDHGRQECRPGPGTSRRSPHHGSVRPDRTGRESSPLGVSLTEGEGPGHLDPSTTDPYFSQIFSSGLGRHTEVRLGNERDSDRTPGSCPVRHRVGEDTSTTILSGGSLHSRVTGGRGPGLNPPDVVGGGETGRMRCSELSEVPSPRGLTLGSHSTFTDLWGVVLRLG